MSDMSRPEIQDFDRPPRHSKLAGQSLTSLVAAAKASIVDPSHGDREIVAKLDQILARYDEGRLQVAALGQFKRGKSTLLNAILGVQLLPTGIIPITAVPTYIRAGSRPHLRMEFENGRPPVQSDDLSTFPTILARYVSESENPANREQVLRVEITVVSTSLGDHVVLLDTPGVGSIFVHNSRAAEAVLSDCDVGVFVLSPDPPITEVELAYLDNVRRLIPKIYFVLNKADLLSETEQAVAVSFLTKVLEEKLGSEQRPVQIFAVSARAALEARRYPNGAALEAAGLPASPMNWRRKSRRSLTRRAAPEQ
jgi:GTP-binding protein EngB required for normal cell division